MYHQKRRNLDIDDPRSNTQYSNQRQRPDFHPDDEDFEDPMDIEQERMNRIRQLLVRIGERSSSSLIHNLEQLSNALKVDIVNYSQFIIDTLFECVTHLSVKIPIYATLVALINCTQPEFGSAIVSKLVQEMKIALTPKNLPTDQTEKQNTNQQKATQIKSTIIQRGFQIPNLDFNQIRLLTRFLVCLHNANIIQSLHLLQFLQMLIKMGVELVNNHLIKEHTVFIVLMSLVWGGENLLMKEKEMVENIMKSVENYMNNRKISSNISSLKSCKNIEIKVLTDLWKEFSIMYEKMEQLKMKTESKDSEIPEKAFEIKSILKPYSKFDRLENGKKHDFLLCIESKWNGLKILLNPIWLEFGILELVPTSATENIRIPKIETLVVTEYIHDIFEFFNQDTKLCAEQLIHLPSSFPSKYLVMEGLISHMIRLPFSRNHSLFYAKVIIELFRKQTKIWPRILGPIINRLFHEISYVDIECCDIIVDWFAYHLSNFTFQWPWHNWTMVVSLPKGNPRRVFIEQILLRCVHLSFYDRFTETLHEQMLPLVGHQPTGYYKYEHMNQKKINEAKINENIPESKNMDEKRISKVCDSATNLLRMLNQRVSAEDINNHLLANIDPIIAKVDQNNGLSENSTLTDIKSMKDIDIIYNKYMSDTQRMKQKQAETLFTCILHVGKSSCSHVTSFLKMYGKLMKDYIRSSAFNELRILQCLNEYWRYSPVRLEILCDKMHAMSFISPLAIVKYVFLEEQIPFLYDKKYWRILNVAIERIVKTTLGAQRGMAKFEADIKALDKTLNSDFGDNERTLALKQKKEKQLQKLTKKMADTKMKISRVFIVFFGEGKRALEYLDLSSMVGSDVNIEMEDEDDEEMDDDLLMSETFVQEQEKKDMESEKNAKMQSMQANTNQYVFDAIYGRMIQVFRKFVNDINDECWDAIQHKIFVFEDVNESKNGNEEKIRQLCVQMKEIRDVLRVM